MAQVADPGKHFITWGELVAFARAADREITHVFRVFKGERTSPFIPGEFERYFGFPMSEASLSGRRRRRVA